MKNILLSLFLLFPNVALAAKKETFDPFVLHYNNGKDEYIGVLLDEEDYANLIESKIKLDANVKLMEDYLFQIKEQDEIIESLGSKIDKLGSDIIKLSKKEEPSWFEENQGWIMFTGGLVLGGFLTYEVVK